MFEKIDYVYAVYKEGNFTKAAQKLFISQPSLSVAVKGVEAEIGAPLFERSGARVTLTEVGREYIAAAEKIMSIRQDFEKRLGDIYGLEVGSLAVGGTNYLSSYVLPRIITEFSSLYPKINVTLAEEHSKTLGEMIRDGRLDVIIDSFERPDADYEAYPLARERIFLCVPAALPVNKGLEEYAITTQSVFDGSWNESGTPSAPIAAFANEGFVLLKNGNDMYNRAISVFERGGISPKILFHVDQLNISYALAESGTGICFVTDTLLGSVRPNPNLLLYNVGDEGLHRTLYIAYKSGRYCTSAMGKFIEIAKKTINKEI